MSSCRIASEQLAASMTQRRRRRFGFVVEQACPGLRILLCLPLPWLRLVNLWKGLLHSSPLGYTATTVLSGLPARRDRLLIPFHTTEAPPPGLLFLSTGACFASLGLPLRVGNRVVRWFLPVTGMQGGSPEALLEHSGRCPGVHDALATRAGIFLP